MKITCLETFLTHAGLRNYLFVRLTTDTGLTGLGEASLEWQERAVQALLHDWVEDRILGTSPFDLQDVISDLIRDQYQGGPTILTAISGVEIALWDLIGKASGEPVFKLLGGQAHDRLPAYANGWYGGANSPEEYASKASQVVSAGYTALKFDPFGVAWLEMTAAEMSVAEERVAAVREAVGDEVQLMIEVHGRLSVSCAIEMGQQLIPYRPAWYEEPVTPHSLDLLHEVKQALPFPIAAGERLYMLEDFDRLTAMQACDIVQMDLAHCGGLAMGKKIAALAAERGLRVSPHCSIGPVALCAALHFDWSTKNASIQENFGDYDVPWRHDFLHGWNPCQNGFYAVPAGPGLGIELDASVCLAHPYQKNPFPSLWDSRWLKELTKRDLQENA